MRRLFPVLVILALLGVGAFLWLRSEPAEHVAPPTEDRPVAVASPDPAAELGAPEAVTAGRSDAATSVAAAPTAVATPTAPSWTGVRVRVLASETREPLANVRMTARIPDTRQSWKDVDDFHGELGLSPRTNDSGIAELELDPGTLCAIHVRRDDGSTSSGSTKLDTPIAAGEVRDLELLLATKADLLLHGRVVDRETNAPIPNARVGRNKGWSQILDPDEQMTDADGRFKVTGQSWTRTIVNVIKPGYEVACVRLFAGHEDATKPFEIALSPVASARVTVLDAAGAPITNVSVSLATATYRFGRPDGMALVDAGWTDDAFFRATTDANGVAVLTDLPPRMPFEGVVNRRREEVMKAPETLTLEPGELRDVVWRMGAGGRIEGVALEIDGRPAPGISIGMEAARIAAHTYFEPVRADKLKLTTTDAEGRFAFADVPPGNCWVGPAPKKIARVRTVEPEDIAPLGQLVVVAAGGDPAIVTVRLHRGLSIRGRVLTPEGAPAPYAHIKIASTTSALFAAENMNDPEGRFVLGPLEAGEYMIHASTIGDSVDSESVRARAGDVDVVLQFRKGGALRGIVVDASTGSPCSAEILVNPRNPTSWGMRSEASDAEGRFEIGGLEPGSYDLAAKTQDGRIGFAAATEVASGPAGDEVRVRVSAGAKVRVRYAGPWPVAGISVHAGGVPVAGDGMEKGTEHTLIAPAGSVVVRIRHYAEKKEFDLPLVLTAGETRDVVFDGAWK